MLLTWGQSNGLNYVNQLAPAAWYRYGLGITTAGSGVSQWSDQSGNARHLLQGVDANRPALQADSSILFDGVDNTLKCASFTFNQPETIYILFKQVTWTLNDIIVDGDVPASMFLYQSASTPGIRLQAGAVSTANTNLAVDTYGVVAAVFNGASCVVQVNNTTPTGGDCGATNAGGFTLGSSGSGSGFSNIQVKEVILYSAAHDATTRDLVIRYLQAVGGI